MKKILTIVLCLAIMLSLCACGKKGGNSDVTPDNTSLGESLAYSSTLG